MITTSDELAGNFGYTLTDGAYEQSGGGQIGSQWTESESNAWAELYELATSATEQAVFYAFDNGSIPAVEEAPAEETPAEETPAEPAEDVVMPSNQALPSTARPSPAPRSTTSTAATTSSSGTWPPS